MHPFIVNCALLKWYVGCDSTFLWKLFWNLEAESS